jgi:hypothetical protein
MTNSGFNLETTKGERMKVKEKQIKVSQTYQGALIATRAIDSAPQKSKSTLRGLMQLLGLAFIASTLVIGATGSASAGQAQDEAAVRALGDTFAKAFVQKNAELRASLFAENGTFVTPVGDFFNGPDGTIIPVIPINFFYVAARHGDRWLIEDGRAHFAPAPANSMTSRN